MKSGDTTFKCYSWMQVADLPEREYQIQELNPDEKRKTTVANQAPVKFQWWR